MKGSSLQPTQPPFIHNGSHTYLSIEYMCQAGGRKYDIRKRANLKVGLYMHRDSSCWQNLSQYLISAFTHGDLQCQVGTICPFYLACRWKNKSLKCGGHLFVILFKFDIRAVCDRWYGRNYDLWSLWPGQRTLIKLWPNLPQERLLL